MMTSAPGTKLCEESYTRPLKLPRDELWSWAAAGIANAVQRARTSTLSAIVFSKFIPLLSNRLRSEGITPIRTRLSVELDKHHTPGCHFNLYNFRSEEH